MSALRTALAIAAMVAAAAFVLTCPDAASRRCCARSSAPAGNAQHGKVVYTRVGCYECHGSDAQSGRPTLGPNAIPFAAFMRQVRVPRNDMPPYTAKVLSDSDVADIYAFVQSVPQPPKADSVPLLK